MPCVPQQDVEEQSPASDLANEEIDPREQVVVLNTLLTASYSRNAELESFVSHFAKLEAESAAEKRALLKELADARAHLDAREQQSPQLLDATPRAERASAAGPSLVSKEQSHADTHAAPSADLSRAVLLALSSSSRATESQALPAGSQYEAAAAPTAQPPRSRLDLKMMGRIRQVAESAVQNLGQRVAKQQSAHMSFQSLHDVLIEASKAMLIQVVCGENPADAAWPGRQLLVAQQKARQVMQASRPDLFALMQEGGYPEERKLLMELAKLTLAESVGFLLR